MTLSLKRTHTEQVVAGTAFCYPMRALFILLLIWCPCGTLHAQPDLRAELHTLPTWMQAAVTAEKPKPSTLPKRAPLHTNAFIGRYSIQKKGGYRHDFWCDKQRIVIQQFDHKGEHRQNIYIDLAANVRMSVSQSSEGTFCNVEDLYIPQAGYFQEIWNDSVHTTGRTERILDTDCRELRGVDGNKDTSYYWSTAQHPELFADLLVWARWLCREGDLKFLSALSDRNAGGSMRVEWPKRRFGTEAGSIAFLSITPGPSPMPLLERRDKYLVFERRFQWMNNSGIGRLPGWMRTYLTALPPDTLPLLFTPPPVDRSIPDNLFIGTFTAETHTRYIGAPGKNGARDTTLRLAKYSYWADARRAVLQLDDPDDECYYLYAVDLDADVAIAAVNEGHSYVVPKLYIGDLSEVGLSDFGRGLDLTFKATGKRTTMLGRTCELHTTYERSLHDFWFPTTVEVNPIFDMRNWLEQRMSNNFKNLMFFGVADKPMPMSVMGTHLTSYRQGKAKPPVIDLSNYQVRDQRIRKQRERARDRYHEETIEVKEITMGDGDMGALTQEAGDDVAVPIDETVNGTPEALKQANSQQGLEGTIAEPEPSVTPVVITAARADSEVPDNTPISLSPYLREVIARPTNRFIGTATLLFTRNYHGQVTTWTVEYASTAERSMLVSSSSEALPSVRTQAISTHRRSGDEVQYQLMPDSSVKKFPSTLRTSVTSPAVQVLTDSAAGNMRTLLDRRCEHRVHGSAMFRRDAWVDPQTPSLFMDLFGARKGWDGLDHILHGYHLGIATDGMPLLVDFFHGDNDRITMRMLELKPGPVDPAVFTVTKNSWR